MDYDDLGADLDMTVDRLLLSRGPAGLGGADGPSATRSAAAAPGYAGLTSMGSSLSAAVPQLSFLKNASTLISSAVRSTSPTAQGAHRRQSFDADGGGGFSGSLVDVAALTDSMLQEMSSARGGGGGLGGSQASSRPPQQRGSARSHDDPSAVPASPMSYGGGDYYDAAGDAHVSTSGGGRHQQQHFHDPSSTPSPQQQRQRQPLYSGPQDMILRRMSLWHGRKLANVEAKRHERDLKELAPCTFEPRRDVALQDCGLIPPPPESGIAAATVSPADTSALEAVHHKSFSPSPLYKENKAWGFDQFIERYQSARQRKDEQKRHEEEVFRTTRRGTGPNGWRPHVTIPEPFELGKQRMKPLQSGSDSFNALADVVRREFLEEPSRIEMPRLPAAMFSLRTSSAFVDYGSRGGGGDISML